MPVLELAVPVLEGVRYSESILDAVGHTPLVRLRSVARRCPATVLAKVECLNPGGSVKDRIGLAMVEAAERAGKLKAGGTIVECTSGNTGAGLALVAAVRGYHAVFVMPDKVSLEKINLLKAYGAEVVITPTAVAPDSPESYYSVAQRIERERPGAVLMNQYHNPANPEAHYRSTGPELWEETGGRIDAFVAGMGTGGTITGTARYLKEKNPKVKIVGVDPVGSILREYFYTKRIGEAHTYKVEGVGEDFIPSVYDFTLIDDVIAVNDRDALNTTRRLAREEGIFVGGSSGMATWAALQVARDLPEGKLVVVLLPDTGDRYLSKVHNDAWMRDNHLLDPDVTRVADVLSGKIPTLPRLLHVDAAEPARKALHLIQHYNVTQLPVFRNQKVVGTIVDNELLKRVLEDASALEKPAESLMEKPLPVVGPDEPVTRVTRLLADRNAAVLVEEGGEVVGILTRFDMLQFIAGDE